MRQTGKNGKRAYRRTSPDAIKFFKVTEHSLLLEFLLKTLSDKSRTTVKSILAHRQVAINRTPTTRYDAVVQPGDEVMINFEKGFKEFKHSRLRIVYEDDCIIVADKGYGLLSMSTDRIKDNTAYHILSDYLKEQDPSARLFILHRLDRDTSGLMMFAKSQGIQEQMQRNWNNIVLERKYVAVVEGVPEKSEGEVRSYLAENAAFQVYTTNNPEEGQLAVTRYKVLKSNGRFSLVELTLQTGRKNQIRVHMKDIGHSIAGDRKYGAKGSPIGRLSLHASKLRFVHPVTRQEMNFETVVPQKFIYLVSE